MKEITRISLASLPYNVEIEAKKELESYLHAIESALGADADAMKEIEARIAELLADRGVNGEKVITPADVEAVKSQLGNPKDFADEDSVTEIDNETSPATRERRLMRDASDQVLGGVCSGLAAYTHVDTVWVRLGFVVLAVVTSGIMIPIYLVMWIIMPPAQTAAERLQMKGKPVTLEAIQEESVVVTKQKERDQTILTVLRIIAGIGVLVIAAAATMGMVGMGYHVVVDEGAHLMTTAEKASAGAMLMAGILFVVFCLVIARALFTNTYAKRFWITVGILSVLGIGSFSTGVLGLGVMRYSSQAAYEKSQTMTKLDATAVASSKSLVVDGEGAVVNYIVTSETPHAELRYVAAVTKTKPQVRIERHGDSLAVAAFAAKPMTCMGFCQGLVTVDVYGPALDTVTVSTGSATYTSTGQKSLSASASKHTTLSLKGEKAIEDLTLNVEGSDVSTSEANVARITLTADSLSNVSLGNINKLVLSAPVSCSNGTRLSVDIATAQSVIVNGVNWSGHMEQTPCMNLSVDNTGK